jgi:pyrimidine-specific ribonucleoside hydrolase
MGGAIGVGNWSPAAEFNILLDPEAASIIFKEGLPITMIPLEVTHTVEATE